MSRKYRDQWEDLCLEGEEVERFGTAIEKEEIRKLTVEFAEEINDPESKKQYENEVAEHEKERGIDTSFITSEPCYVIQSSIDGQKAFINICKNDEVGKPTSVSRGRNWSLPFTQAPAREELDKNANRCKVFDVMFHPDTLRLAENSVQCKKMLNNTALDAVEDNFDVKLDRKNLKFPKLKYRGCPMPTAIRKKMEKVPITKDEFSVPDNVHPYKFPVEDTETQVKHVRVKKRAQENEVGNTSNLDTPYTTPVYVMKHRHPIDIQDFSNDRDAKMNAATPKELVIEVQLPLLNSSADMILDVTQKSISLVSEKPAKYKLDLLLPYTVDEEAGNAKFDRSSRKLVITLLVRHQNDLRLSDIGREDSGVESDVGLRTPQSSSDENDENVTNQNSIAEIQRDETELPEITSDEPYWTINMNKNKFLNPDVDYLFPAFTCSVVDSLVAFTLHVKNAAPESIEYCFLCEDCCGIHLRFMSIRSYDFPIHYAFCLKFPSPVSICNESFSAEAWDNNVIVQMQLKSCDTNVMEYYAGVNSNLMVKYDLPEPASVVRKLEKLKIEALSNNSENDMKVEVTKYSEDEVVIEISPDKMNKKEDDAGDEDDDVDDDHDNESKTSGAKSVVGAASSQHCTNTNVDICHNAEAVSQLYYVHAAPYKYRSLSESSGDELSFSPSRKGILKNNDHMSHNVPVSNMDAYTLMSSVGMVTHSGSEFCIPEEATEGERETEKTVRFNEVVSQRTYRTNSSILGQRKKNQRKTRNKRRCQERRASESENSEGGEKEWERERRTDDEKEKSEIVFEDKLSTSSNSGDPSPTFQESRDLNEAEDDTSKPFNAGCPSEQSPNKGKRNNQKGAVALDASIPGVPQEEFGSDMIFDLDM